MNTAVLRPLLLGLFSIAWAVPASASAGGTRTFKVSDYAALDRGETQGAAIESTGKVTVGYLPQRGEITHTTAFSCLAEAKSVLIGTADQAAIVRVYPSRSKRADAALKVEAVAELEGVLVSAMARLPNGDTVAATVPGGALARVTRKGKVSPFATLPAEQVWALLVHKGRLLAATGPKGQLYAMSLSGQDPTVVLDVDTKNVLSLATVGDDIIVGTSPRAQIYRVTDTVDGELLHAFSGNEVRALAVGPHGLAAAVNTFADRKLSSLDALSKTLRRTSLTGAPPSGTAGSERPPSADGSLHVVDLGPKLDLARATEAPWEQWLERSEQYFTSLLPTPEGQVLVGTSDGGKVYRASGPRSVSTVADFDERQTTALCRIANGPTFAATAHGAGVYQLRAAAASQAKFRTQVHDAHHPARWGAVRLRGSGPLSVRARVGPTEEPDGRWTDWTSIRVISALDGLRGTLGTLPKRRYLELEVGLDAADAELRSLEAFYAPENLAPVLTSVEVAAPTFDRTDRREPSPKVKIKWKVDARDEDDLVYDVRIRPEGGSDGEWVKLNQQDEPVTAKELSLDLSTVPDGIYEVEVTASDEPTNGNVDARTDELVSDPFVVDRQRPSVTPPRVQGARVTATATDAGGYVHDASYSIDGGRFRTAGAGDGMFDSPEEQVVFDLPPDLSPGRHRVILRVRDAFGNLTTVPLSLVR